jgi:hypothetical protein
VARATRPVLLALSQASASLSSRRNSSPLRSSVSRSAGSRRTLSPCLLTGIVASRIERSVASTSPAVWSGVFSSVSFRMSLCPSGTWQDSQSASRRLSAKAR